MARLKSPVPPHPHPLHVARSMTARGVALFPIAGVMLGAGMLIYHQAEGLPWTDAFLNAAMLLGGMGPVDKLQTPAGKWLAGAYAMVAGLFFIVLAGVMLGPVIHGVLHRFKLSED